MKQKPQLSFWQIWNMCFGFLGIQFGFALQNANVSRIFQTLGAEIEDLPILWVAAPVTGLIVQPIIGYMSDRTWNRLGRRRPFFLFGAILASLALFAMPNSPYLWVAAGMLWIMDASINISMEPFRAFVGDNLPKKQRTLGFAMQSFFIGIGAIVASALPWMMTNWFDVSNSAAAGQIPDSVKWSFYLGGIVFCWPCCGRWFSAGNIRPKRLQSSKRKRTRVVKCLKVHSVLLPATGTAAWPGWLWEWDSPPGSPSAIWTSNCSFSPWAWWPLVCCKCSPVPCNQRGGWKTACTGSWRTCSRCLA
jgi:maltose/moltooligosaccharide transporter